MPPQTMRQFLKPPEKAPDTLPRTQSTMSLLDYFSTVIQGLADPTGWTEPKAEDFDNPHAYTQALKAHGVGQLIQMAAPLAAPLGVLTRGARTAEVAAEAPQTLKAFHGSPHDFGTVGERGAFKMSAIGSGEGGQAYSYGHYFAQNPSVSETYREMAPMVVKVGDKQYEMPMRIANLDPVKDRGKLEQALAEQTKQLAEWEASPGVAKQDYMQAPVKDARRIKAGLEALLSGEGKLTRGGRMYELNLHTSPESLLDWDKPLSQQPHIIEKLKQAGLITGTKQMGDWEALIGPGGVLIDPKTTTGDKIYSTLVSQHGGRAGHTEGIASQQLADAGIHGVQYLDQGSRPQMYRGDQAYVSAAKSFQSAGQSAEDALSGLKQAYKRAEHTELTQAVNEAYGSQLGTRNYVIFPHFEHLIEISKKYGISLPAAASLYKWQQSQQQKGVE